MKELKSILPPLILIWAAISQVHGYDSSEIADEGADLKHLFLDVYVDEGGKAMLIGYVEPQYLYSLSFLERSDYIYDDDTFELYALSDSLAIGDEDGWELNLTIRTGFDECELIFYLPAESELEALDLSEGLEYEIFRLEDSLVVDVYGYDVERPAIRIEYMSAGRSKFGG